MFFTMANVGLPGTSGFVGEFLTLAGIFQVNTWVAAVATRGPCPEPRLHAWRWDDVEAAGSTDAGPPA